MTDELYRQLAQALEANHYCNEHGVWLTDYAKIPGLKVLASTTSGTSGIGKCRGRKIYWTKGLNGFTVTGHYPRQLP